MLRQNKTSNNLFFAQVQFCIGAILTHQYIPLQYFSEKSDNFLTLFFANYFFCFYLNYAIKIFALFVTTCFSIILLKVCKKPESFRLYMGSLKTIPQNIVVKLSQTTYYDIWEQDVGSSRLFTPTTKTLVN